MAAEPSEQTSVGTLLNGSYLLERVIAEGGMGVVYEAQHLRLPRKFAVKVLGKPKDAALASTALPRFRREAEIAATLAHPHIVEVFDFQVSEGGSPYLVMELLEGEDLNDHLKRRGRMPAAAALRIIEEIAEALDVAHQRGVVHRDLKPANIFLSRRGDRDDFVKVLDFGVSKLIDAATLTQEKAMVGTPLYMSPEQAVGTQELTPESDVFSLGSIAFEILSGRRAFAASSIPSILYQIVHGPTPTLIGRAPGLGPEVDEVFSKVLAKNKKDRYATTSEFARALATALKKPEGPVNVDAWAPLDLGGMGMNDGGSGLIRGGATSQASMTDIDNSTRAQELPSNDSPPTPSNEPSPTSFDRPRSTGLTGLVFPPRNRGPMWAVGGGAAVLAVFAIVALMRDPPAPAVAPVAAPAPVAVAPPAPAPPPTETAARAMEFSPDPVSATTPARRPDVQFVFHVVPKIALVTVDEKRVVGHQVTMPWQPHARRIKITAPGFAPITMTVPSTASRTFEMHLDRATRAPEPKKPRNEKLHDAAPVQDL